MTALADMFRNEGPVSCNTDGPYLVTEQENVGDRGAARARHQEVRLSARPSGRAPCGGGPGPESQRTDLDSLTQRRLGVDGRELLDATSRLAAATSIVLPAPNPGP